MRKIAIEIPVSTGFKILSEIIGDKISNEAKIMQQVVENIKEV